MKRKALNGEWTLKDLQTGKILPACVPGDVTADFYRAGEVPDPYFGMNYKDERYLLDGDYEYALTFSADKAKAGEKCFLVFDGIDTYAEISLNGKALGKTDNMFLGYEYDVTELLSEKNELRVHMRSTLGHMKEIDAEKYFACFNKERIFMRKAQCHFGWDWAPDLPGYGIYNDVYLDYRPETAIESVRVVTDMQGNVTLFTHLNYNVRTEACEQYAKTDTLRYTVAKDPNGNLQNAYVLEFPVGGAKNFRSLKIENPKLWMPIGYGQPNLYAYKAELLRDGKVIDCREGKLGLREVTLVQKPIDGEKLSFRLEVNGADVFVKGSNWVPCDAFTGIADEERYKKLVGLAADAGFNMLRVWGGGIYEKDIFYALCDELGLMVWQDFMFACADIPETDAAFVENVTKECIYQVKRLRNHPSLVYWCGGNEKTGSCGLLKQYGDNLVDITIRGIVGHYDGTRPYVRQSPYSLSDIGNDPESGETHGTAFDPTSLQSLDEFYKSSFAREVSFASECAVMGSCVPESYRKFVPEGELWPLGDIYEDRFCDNPYGAIMSFVQRQLRMVDMTCGAANGIDEFAVKSMAVQAEALQTEARNTRRKRGACGGFLNWMFNDIWPTGTWSLVDYYLKPKAAYYAIKREYAPVRVMVVPDGNGKYFAYLVNDTAEAISTTVECGAVTLGGKYAAVKRVKVKAEGYSVKELGEIKPEGDAVYATCEIAGKPQEAHAFTRLMKDLKFTSEYELRVGKSEKRGDAYATEVTVRAKSLLRLARLCLPEGATPSDDWFDVLPSKIKTVEILSREPIKEIALKDYTQYVQETL